MKNIIKIFLIILPLISISCEKELRTGELAGKVVFAGTTIPVNGVLIRLGDTETLTDEDGNFSIRSEVGKYKLETEKEGFDSFSDDLKLIHGKIDIYIELSSSEFTTIVFGTVRGNYSGRAQSGIHVLMLNPDDTESAIQDESDQQGNFVLEGVPHGERMIVVVSDDIIIFQAMITLEVTYYQLDILFPEPYTFIDSRDGNEYWALKIGSQTWMIENLAWLPSVSGPANGSYTEPYYYVLGYLGNSSSDARNNSNYMDYGVLYNWMGAKTGCPPGWHLPSDEEWKTLELFLGLGIFDAIADGARRTGEVGQKLKSETGWSNNGNGNNSSKFNALPVGSRIDSGEFDHFGFRATMWTSTPSTETFAWSRGFGSNVYWVDRDRHDIQNGLSVRCVKD